MDSSVLWIYLRKVLPLKLCLKLMKLVFVVASLTVVVTIIRHFSFYKLLEHRVREVDGAAGVSWKSAGESTHLTTQALQSIANRSKKFVLPVSDLDLLNFSSGCTNLLSLYHHVSGDGVSSEEMNYPLAYSLIIHQDAAQVERLLRAIYRPQNLYCIHTDKKSSETFREAISSLCKCFPNVFLASQIISVQWARSSQVEAHMNCMRDLLAKWGDPVRWRYALNVAGHEYPLKTNREIVKICQILSPYNFIAADTSGHSLALYVKARTGYNPETKSGRDPPPFNITIYKGSSFGLFSRDFVHYVLHNETCKQFWRWLKNGSFTDELYFNSLNNNPHLKVPGGREVVDLQRKGFIRAVKFVRKDCGGISVRGFCVFGLSDLPWLMASDALFANKLYANHKLPGLTRAYDELEKWFHNKMVLERTFPASKTKLNIPFYQRIRVGMKRI